MKMKLNKKYASEYIKNHDEMLIFSIAFAVEILFGLILINKFGSTYFDLDSVSYMYNARNVLDNGVYSGFSALVGTWLPLFELAQVPFILSDAFYTTGFSGTVVNAIMTGGICVFLYRILGGKTCRYAILAPVMYLSNIYVLIYGAIPMTEQMAVFFLVAASYYFKKYMDTAELKEYIKCSVILVFGSLVKYEIWFAAVFVVLVFSVNEILRNRRHRIGYAHLPLLGILVWLFANYMIHRDWLWFINNPSSAFTQNSLYPQYFYWSVYLTLRHAFMQMDITVGILLYLAAASVVLLIALRRIKWIVVSVVLIIPSVLNIVLMYQGHSSGWQRYFYTQIPAIVLLTVLLIENISKFVVLLSREMSFETSFETLKKHHGNIHMDLVVISIIAVISVVGASFASIQSADPSVSVSRLDNRPWIYQGLDITNERIFFIIDNEKKTYVSDFSLDFLNKTRYRSYHDVRNIIGNDKILMPSFMVTDKDPGIRADLFSVSEGISPGQIIDGFDYKEYDGIMEKPWNSIKFVVIVPVDDSVAKTLGNWYKGNFYLYNYYYNEAWRTVFLKHYRQVLDNGNFQIFELNNTMEENI